MIHFAFPNKTLSYSGRQNESQSNPFIVKKVFSGLFTGVALMTLLSEPAVANKTYSRAKTCYQNQYVEIYHPGTREKPGYVSSREERVERTCPKTLHFHGRKSHKHKEGHHAHNHSAHPPKTSGGRKVVATPAAEDDNSCLEGTIAGGVLGGALGGALAKKDNWIWSIPAEGCWRCPCLMSGRWRLSLYRVHTKCWLEKPAIAVQTNAQQIHPDVTNSDHH